MVSRISALPLSRTVKSIDRLLNYRFRGRELRQVTTLQLLRHVIAVFGIVGHHEQDGLLAQLLVFLVDLAPLDHAQVDIVGVLLGVFDDRFCSCALATARCKTSLACCDKRCVSVM